MSDEQYFRAGSTHGKSMSETPAPTRPLDPGLSAAELTRIVTELSYDLDDARADSLALREALDALRASHERMRAAAAQAEIALHNTPAPIEGPTAFNAWFDTSRRTAIVALRAALSASQETPK